MISQTLLGGLGGFPKSTHQNKNARSRAQFRRTTRDHVSEALSKTNRSDKKPRFGCKDKPRQRDRPAGSGGGNNEINKQLPKKYIPWC